MKQGGKHSDGFTIVETLIVLLVSGFLAASALVFMSGRQNKTEFQTGINNLQQQFQQVINETVSGYYPNNDDFTCSTVLGGHPSIVESATPTAQGANSSCIFVGKAFVFGPNFPDSGGSTNNYRLYPLAGSRVDSTGSNDVTSPQTANVVAIAKSTPTGLNPSAPDSSIESKSYDNGIDFQWASFVNAAGVTLKQATYGRQTVFSIVSSFAGYSGTQLDSKGQNYTLYGFKGISPLGGWDLSSLNNSGALVDQMNLAGVSNSPYKQVQLCFASGTTDQSGLITIGDIDSGGLGVTLQIYNQKVCA